MAVALLTIVVAACGSKKKKDETVTTTPAGQGVTPETAGLPQTKDGVVAKVEGQDIKAPDVAGEIQRLRSQMAQIPPEQAAQMEPMLQKQAVENAINRKLLIMQAGREGVTVSDADVDQEFAKFRAQFPDSATYIQQMQGAGLDEKTVKLRLKENLLINKIVEKHTANVPAVTAQDVEKFYRENPEQFRVPDQVRASHILVRSETTDPPELRNARRARADSILTALKKGADFATTAKEHSEDPGSASRGGDLDFFARGQMVPAFEAVAFSLQVGQMSDVVETPFGFHIVKVTGKKPASTVSLDEVRPRLTEFLMNRNKSDALQTWVIQLRTQSKVEVADSTGKLVPLPPPSKMPAAPPSASAPAGGGGQ